MAKSALVAHSDLIDPLPNELALLVPHATAILDTLRNRVAQTLTPINFRKQHETTIASRHATIKSNLDTLFALDL